ncbi:XrtA/PEP-CTERM system histidine kinase PrsK [Sphingomonas sp.]|uniref:XrtA/PEP-CTERM system histidine kinase PrsK n=1 Tax=Sphingomonas sp. TaxID=28214 RepID=UPI0025F8FE91|nr:XrtA/PEP-CTERM system histidine kinase PrsK [Sphingomonas sp.]
MASLRGKLRPSRTAALGLLGLLAGATYFLVIVGLSALLHAQEGTATAIALMIVPLVSAVVAAVVLPAERTRAWFRVMTAKHLFAHRYDYRAEWLRFTDTLSRPGEAPAALEVRVIKAIADIADSPGGLLLLPDGGEMLVKANWNWAVASHGATARLADFLASGRIVELDAVRADDIHPDEAGAIPEWILAAPGAWAIVPLIHVDRLAGAVLLERPLIGRTLDWEDFDLLRVAGRQVASYLAEAQGQDALSEAQRFDEFNRRFAFIMHDIKNLVSQMGLLARNAERHADNPAFQVDMISTLHSSTARMNDLLARLSQHNKARPEEPRAIAIGTIVASVAAAKRAVHPIVLAGDTALLAIADPARLEAALAHLVQNAIEASEGSEPVTLTIRGEGRETVIQIIDKGCGMTADFLHSQLFRPFSSTKDSGFGIGAYEARTLIGAMGGRLSVKSELGLGSCFTIALPSARGWAEERAA